MAKLRIAVLFGGVSSEHEISCLSAATVVRSLDADRYEVTKLGITKKGRWMAYPGGPDGMADGSWETCADNVPAFISPDRTTHGIVLNHAGRFDVVKVDVCFPVLHGKNGEDGTVQGLLAMAGIPCVGCGVFSSAACMDKAAANLIFGVWGLPHTPWMAVHRQELDDYDGILFRMREKMDFPVFVKPAAAGSSVGCTRVDAEADLRNALLLASIHDDTVLLEKAVDGIEVECAVLGNQTLVATRPGEIESCNDSYDYEAKYHSGGKSKLYIPARLPNEKLDEVRAIAEKAYKAMGCAGLARVDFFVERGTNRVLLSELNTMPGFTDISMYPKLMEAEGIPLPTLVDRLVQLALESAED